MLRALVLVLAFPAIAFAQAYPSKPARWILGDPPGGGTEFIARNVANLGYPDFEVFAWRGLVVPAATPRDIVNRLSTELVRTLIVD